MKTKNNLRLEMEFYRMAAGDYRPLPELPNRTSPSRGPRGLKKYCEHSGTGDLPLFRVGP